ncbi:Proton-coupled folate transporter [Trichoplax sp. H2]|nr:Proton-coupled folate transporter [Trichoplax sp. H2]|eukprot:RDD45636.1 Proton-coupled folate transporter [Trichoplax sp. H2]
MAVERSNWLSTLAKIPRSITVEPVLFLFMFCQFSEYALVMFLIRRKVCLNYLPLSICSNSSIRLDNTTENSIESQTSTYIFYLNLSFIIPSVCASIILGNLSDKLGRKVVMILPCIGAGIKNVIFLINAYLIDKPVPYMYIGSAISGFFGNYPTLLMAVFSYISDISHGDTRSSRIGILESMTFIGGSMANFISGRWLDTAGFLPPFWANVIIYFCLILYIIFVITESYHPTDPNDNQQVDTPDQNRCSTFFSMRNFQASYKVIIKPRVGHLRIHLILLVAIFFLNVIIFNAFNNIIYVYLKHPPLSLTPTSIGDIVALKLCLNGIAAIIVMPILSKILHFNDTSLIMIGVLSSTASWLYIGFIRSPSIVFIGSIIDGLTGMAIPSCRAMLSKIVNQDELGKMFGFISATEVLTSLLASAIANGIYSATVRTAITTVFITMASLTIIPLALTSIIHVDRRRQRSGSFYVHINDDHIAANGVNS